MSPFRARALVVVAALVVGGGGALAFERWRGAPPHALGSEATGAVEAEPEAPPTADWCAAGYEAIPGGCFATPSTPSPGRPLVVYLHGRYDKAAASEEVDRQKRLAERATARGFPVLALRGRLGECTSAELASWYCWPSNPRNADSADDVVAGWKATLAEASKRAGASKRVVLGFSNGGYFAALLATRALLDADAYVVAHGGPVDPVHATKGTPPMLLLSADDDVAQDDMITLDADLTREQWAHDAYARAGAHGLTDGDIDAALTFFERSHEKLPLDPPLALHRPEHHTHVIAETAGTAL